MLDEVKTASDIVEIWHIDPNVAARVFELFDEVILGGQKLLNRSDGIEDESVPNDIDDLDESSESDSE